MSFTITGEVVERESGRRIAGLVIRPYDADLLYDDVLGSTVTGDDGSFTMSYRERDFAELFEHRPDVYLSIESPLGTHLHDTEQCAHWEASGEAHFTVELDRAVLGYLSPSRPSGRVESGVPIGVARPGIEQRGGFHT
ncbi:MAG: hypothetical protein ACRDYV_16525, partial [Acidimicrobiia bacterium]